MNVHCPVCKLSMSFVCEVKGKDDVEAWRCGNCTVVAEFHGLSKAHRNLPPAPDDFREPKAVPLGPAPL